MAVTRISTPLLALLAVTLAMTVQIFTPDSVLRGDPFVYAEYADAILDGSIPYVDFEFEHFPLSAIPITAAGLLSRSLGVGYQVAFVLVTIIAVVGLAQVVEAIGKAGNDPSAGRRWVWLALPMMPFALYRLDAWSTLLAALAFFLASGTRAKAHTSMTLLGVATKGWPAVLAVLDWVRNRRTQAVVIVSCTAILVAGLLATPGFRSGREFDGVHLETLFGSLTLAGRLAAGSPHQIMSDAGALYIATGVWSLVANLVVGLVVFGAAIAVDRRRRVPDAWLVSAVVLGVLLASPLLSAQFILWLTPFVALTRRRDIGFLVAATGGLSTWLLAWWAPTDLAWALLLVSRNILLLATAVVLISVPRLNQVEGL